MTGGRFPSVGALTVSAPAGPSLGDPPAFPSQTQALGCLQVDFLWMAVADSAVLFSTTFHHSPSLTGWSTHLFSRMHFVFVHSRLKARG